jgi:hypothetical protein
LSAAGVVGGRVVGLAAGQLGHVHAAEVEAARLLRVGVHLRAALQVSGPK